jgi:YegS/Rv2252/BmrU family lipid kinase
MRRAVVIVNPAARGGASREHEILRAFSALGAQVDVHRTTGEGDAGRIATALRPKLVASAEPLYVLGGDGTVMEAVNALVGCPVPVGVLPGGTGNQLARLLRIPLHPQRAVRALARPRVELLDLGRLADGRHFALTAGMGLDAAMIAGTPTASKRRFGVAAYVASAARAVWSASSFGVEIVANGERVEREAGLVMIANVASVLDGRFSLGPEIAHDDGWLNVAVLSPRGLRDGLTLASRLARGDFRPDPRMLFIRTRAVQVTADRPVPMQADGELLPGATLDATVVPAAARFLAPFL